MLAISGPYGVPVKQIVPRYVDQLGARVFQMTLRAAEEETFRKPEPRAPPTFLNLSTANCTLRFIDVQVFHVHRMDRGENIRRALYDALTSLWQDHRGARRQENELVAIANGNERQEVALHENYLRTETVNGGGTRGKWRERQDLKVNRRLLITF